jgi:hypothetical protein
MRWILLGLGVIALSACTTQPTVIRADFTKAAGVYVVGYALDPAIRTGIEEQLVADLRARQMIAFPSHVDIPDITASNRSELIASANARQVISVIVINPVAADASDSIVEDPNRVSPTHPDLQAFYAYSKSQQQTFDPSQRVFAEVNLFILDGEAANLYWSGTTWSFHADGEGTAIRGISETIADQLQQVRESARSNAFTR